MRRIGSGGERLGVEEKDWEWRRKVGSGGEGLGVDGKDWIIGEEMLILTINVFSIYELKTYV